jgi:hypothetical protein
MKEVFVEQERQAELSGVDREIVSTLIETGAIDFEAIGQTIAKVGPRSVMIDDGWERFCGSDLSIYRWPRRFGLEELGALRDIAQQMQQRMEH